MTDAHHTSALAAVAPPAPVVEVVRDLDRIMALSRRSPVVCDVDPVTKLLPPATQALVEVMTAKFSRGPRLSCACRPRVVTKGVDGRTLTITRVLPERVDGVDFVPEPPLVTALDAFVADNRTSDAEAKTAAAVRALRPGEAVELPAADSGGESAGVGHPCITTLIAGQAWTLREAPKVGGIIGHIVVGGGKTLCGILAPLVFPDCSLAVLLCEPSQRRHYKSQYLRVREHFRVPSIRFDDEDGHSIDGAPVLHVVPYSLLSLTRSSDLLEVLRPDVIIADEAHRIAPAQSSGQKSKGGGSSRAGRVKRYFTAALQRREEDVAAGRAVRGRAVRLLAWSGTLEQKSIKDSQHLAAYALGSGSPLPLDPDDAEAWSAVLDPSRMPDRTSSTAKALARAFGGGGLAAVMEGNESAAGRLAAVMGGGPEEAIREGFRRRRQETLGVISASPSSVGASIYVSEWDAPAIPDAVRRALIGVRDEWLRPDGDEIVEKSAQVAISREVAAGFFYYWAFPGIKCLCGGSVDSPCEGCRRIKDWYDARKRYGAELRVKLTRGEVHLDSPKLCANAAVRARNVIKRGGRIEPGATRCAACGKLWPCSGEMGSVDDQTSAQIKALVAQDTVEALAVAHDVLEERGVRRVGNVAKDHLPAWNAEAWPAWDAIRDTVAHDSRVRWIDDYLARAAAAWAKSHRGIVWYSSDALGRKVAELAGLPCHGGGPGAEEAIDAETGKRSIVASKKAHGSGRDKLQYKFAENLDLEVAPSNAINEQLYGRTHRQGQDKDVVKFELCLHVLESREALKKARQQAEFIYATTGNQQKLLLADYSFEV